MKTLVSTFMAVMIAGSLLLSEQAWSAFTKSTPTPERSTRQAPKKTAVKKSVPNRKKKRKVARTRKEMILEVEMKALKEAISIKKDQENSNQFVSKAEQEYEKAKVSSEQARTRLEQATGTIDAITNAQATLTSILEKAKAAAVEVQALYRQAKQESKLANVESVTLVSLRQEARQDVVRAQAREAMALTVLDQTKRKEAYYRSLVKRRLRNAEDFYYIADAAMKKGGNAQAMEFAIKAKSEMAQAKVAEDEANIRAEAVKAATKVLAARKSSTATAKTKSSAYAKLLALTKEISLSLTEASEAARLSSSAAQKVVKQVQSFIDSKSEILTFSNKKVASLTDIKDASERKELLSGEAVQSSRAVLIAKQKAQAQAESRARGALAEAKSLVIAPPPVEESAPAQPSVPVQQ